MARVTVEDCVDKEGVMDILETSGLGLPDYYKWRSRSGCTFCFFQKKSEWIGLKENHPKAWAHAKSLEKTADKHDSPFTWIKDMPLTELEKPEVIEKVKSHHKKQLEKLKLNKKPQLVIFRLFYLFKIILFKAFSFFFLLFPEYLPYRYVQYNIGGVLWFGSRSRWLG